MPYYMPVICPQLGTTLWTTPRSVHTAYPVVENLGETVRRAAEEPA